MKIQLKNNENLEGVFTFETNRSVDDRGSFLNIDLNVDFNSNKSILEKNSPSKIPFFKRSYLISNHKAGVVRAFHGHKNEAKMFYVARGTFKFIIMEMTESNTTNQNWKEFILSSDKPLLLFVPPKYYNGFVSLTADNLLICFSSSSIDESIKDDYRLPYNDLGEDVWSIKNR
jgi:dTDP-4-dehydrorhamnose 3,5-epimerase-like enzyme